VASSKSFLETRMFHPRQDETIGKGNHQLVFLVCQGEHTTGAPMVQPGVVAYDD